MDYPYVMRQATIDDLDTVMSIVGERTDWLRERGSDQWSGGSVYDSKFVRRVERGFTWLLEDLGTAIATVTVFQRCGSLLWTEQELVEPSLFAWKLATSVDRAGQGLTGLLYRWGQDYAATRGLDWIRWTVHGPSHGLRAYYSKLGAEEVRTVQPPDGPEIALFQLRTRRVPDLDKRIITQQAPSAEAPVIRAPRGHQERSVPVPLGV